MSSPFRSQVQTYNMGETNAYTPYAAGAKLYGAGRGNPTTGPVDKTGYVDRDLRQAAMRNALLAKMQAAQQGNYNSPNYLGGPV